MKRTLTNIILLLLPVLAWGAADFNVYTSQGQPLYYRIIDGNSVAVTYPGPDENHAYQGFSAPASNLVVPNSVSHMGTTYAVVAIDPHAFHGCQYLTSVTLPSTINSVGHHAFAGCTLLNTVVLPTGINKIENSTFVLCSHLTNVSIGDSVARIEYSAFEGCSQLSVLRLPSKVQRIDEYALAGCTSLDTLFVGNETPPLLHAATFDGVNLGDIVAVVPCGTSESYAMASCWQQMGQRLEADSNCWVLLHATSSDSTRGEVIGSGRYRRHSNVPVYAVAHQGNYLHHWNNGSSDNPYLLTIESDTSLTAFFQPIVADTLRDTVLLLDTLLLHDTLTVQVLVVTTDTLFLTDTVLITNTLTTVDTLLVTDTVIQHLWHYDTVTVTQHDTVIRFYWVHDTVVSTQHDTVTRFYWVHDTVHVYHYDTVLLPQVDTTVLVYHDTLYAIVHDTLLLFIHDTTSITYRDTIYTTLHDTIHLHDTSFIYLPDTTYLVIHDTLTHILHDTISVPFVVHDTTYIAYHDTLFTTLYDTVLLHDTLSVSIHDTSFVTLHDTIQLYYHDTVVTVFHDTVFTIQHDTLWIHDTVAVHQERCAMAVVSNNTLWGIGIGTGRYSCGDELEIGALPMEGYRFTKWNDGYVNNPRRVTLQYDSTLVAFFEPTTSNPTEEQNCAVWSERQTVCVAGATGRRVTLYDMSGRCLSTSTATGSPYRIAAPSRGVYVVQVGSGRGLRVVVNE